ncbi:MAG TPA: hypothetical protein VHN13_18120, partial [Candidatus Tectomicrobia bacterium]|nr:hypothetical protein [Candidatus Tectomicrobia bacterium]
CPPTRRSCPALVRSVPGMRLRELELLPQWLGQLPADRMGSHPVLIRANSVLPAIIKALS